MGRPRRKKAADRSERLSSSPCRGTEDEPARFTDAAVEQLQAFREGCESYYDALSDVLQTLSSIFDKPSSLELCPDPWCTDREAAKRAKETWLEILRFIERVCPCNDDFLAIKFPVSIILLTKGIRSNGGIYSIKISEKETDQTFIRGFNKSMPKLPDVLQKLKSLHKDLSEQRLALLSSHFTQQQVNLIPPAPQHVAEYFETFQMTLESLDEEMSKSYGEQQDRRSSFETSMILVDSIAERHPQEFMQYAEAFIKKSKLHQNATPQIDLSNVCQQSDTKSAVCCNAEVTDQLLEKRNSLQPSSKTLYQPQHILSNKISNEDSNNIHVHFEAGRDSCKKYDLVSKVKYKGELPQNAFHSVETSQNAASQGITSQDAKTSCSDPSLSLLTANTCREHNDQLANQNTESFQAECCTQAVLPVLSQPQDNLQHTPALALKSSNKISAEVEAGSSLGSSTSTSHVQRTKSPVQSRLALESQTRRSNTRASKTPAGANSAISVSSIQTRSRCLNVTKPSVLKRALTDLTNRDKSVPHQPVQGKNVYRTSREKREVEDSSLESRDLQTQQECGVPQIQHPSKTARNILPAVEVKAQVAIEMTAKTQVKKKIIAPSKGKRKHSGQVTATAVAVEQAQADTSAYNVEESSDILPDLEIEKFQTTCLEESQSKKSCQLLEQQGQAKTSRPKTSVRTRITMEKETLAAVSQASMLSCDVDFEEHCSSTPNSVSMKLRKTNLEVSQDSTLNQAQEQQKHTKKSPPQTRMRTRGSKKKREATTTAAAIAKDEISTCVDEEHNLGVSDSATKRLKSTSLEASQGSAPAQILEQQEPTKEPPRETRQSTRSNKRGATTAAKGKILVARVLEESDNNVTNSVLEKLQLAGLEVARDDKPNHVPEQQENMKASPPQTRMRTRANKKMKETATAKAATKDELLICTDELAHKVSDSATEKSQSIGLETAQGDKANRIPTQQEHTKQFPYHTRIRTRASTRKAQS